MNPFYDREVDRFSAPRKENENTGVRNEEYDRFIYHASAPSDNDKNFKESYMYDPNMYSKQAKGEPPFESRYRYQRQLSDEERILRLSSQREQRFMYEPVPMPEYPSYLYNSEFSYMDTYRGNIARKDVSVERNKHRRRKNYNYCLYYEGTDSEHSPSESNKVKSNANEVTDRNKVVPNDGKRDKDVVIEDVISGKNTIMSLMLRNLPNRYTLNALQNVLDSIIPKKYSIVNMPIDKRTKRNLGYVFLSVADNQSLYVLYVNLQNQRWPYCKSEKKCRICYTIDKPVLSLKNNGVSSNGDNSYSLEEPHTYQRD